MSDKDMVTTLDGEPEVVGYVFRWDYDHGNGWSKNQIRFVESMGHVEHEDQSSFRGITPVVSQAHVAPLLADNDRLREELAKLADDYCKRTDELISAKSRIAELEAGQPATAKLNGVTPDEQ